MIDQISQYLPNNSQLKKAYDYYCSYKSLFSTDCEAFINNMKSDSMEYLSEIQSDGSVLHTFINRKDIWGITDMIRFVQMPEYYLLFHVSRNADSYNFLKQVIKENPDKFRKTESPHYNLCYGFDNQNLYVVLAQISSQEYQIGMYIFE